MDDSETYIKMSIKAWGKSDNHFSDADPNNVYPHIYVDSSGDWWYRTGEEDYPLYRQDQLQGMIGYSVLNLLYEFYKFIQLKKCPSYAAIFTSIEQLWLAFVMREKFNKVWDGTNWR